MIKDPNALYTGEKAIDPPPKVKSSTPVTGGSLADADSEYLKWRGQAPQEMSRAGGSFQAPKAYGNDYQKYFGDTGVYDPALSGEDIALTMGSRQGVGEKIARRLGTFVPNVAAGIIDMVGYTGALLTEWGDNRDYSNGLTEAAQGLREWSKDNIGATYRRSNDVWALSDPTWWIDNFVDTGEWAASFALGGAGIGKLAGAAAKGVSTALNLGTKGSRLVMGAAQLGTSGLVSYAEAAQAGGQVYSEVYKNQLNKAIADGLDPQEAADKAKHIAAQSAATAAQLGTLLTMGLNVGAYAPLFRTQENVTREIISKRLAQLEGASIGDIGKAIRGMNAADYVDKLIHHEGIKGILKEMAGEGAEEFLQQFAQQTGTDLGNKGKTKNFLTQFGELENMINRTANSEGLLAFTLGAAFGGLQHGLLHNVIPSKRVERLGPDGTPIQKYNADGTEKVDKSGNPIIEKVWVTPRKYERDFTQRAFESVKDAIAADFEHHADLETEFLNARKKGNQMEADEARDRMFDPTRLQAIKQGMADPWIKTFEGIGKLDNETVGEDGQTEAMRKGYADAPGTKAHTEAAEQAIKDIKHLSSVYEGLQNTYGTKYQDMEHIQPLVDMVFAREADLYSMKNRIDKYQKQLTDQVTKEQAQAEVLSPEDFSQNVHNYMQQHNSAKEVERQLLEDHKTLLNGSKKEVDKLLRKYRAVGMGDGKTAEAIKVLDGKLRRKQEEIAGKVKTAEDALFNGPEFQKWQGQNEGGSFDQYLKEMNEFNNLSATNRAMAAQVESAQAQYDIARQHLHEMTKEKNVFRFTKKVSEWQEQMRKEAERVERQNTEKLSELTKDKTALTRLQKIGLNRIAEQYKNEHATVTQKLAANNQRIEAAVRELKGIRAKDAFKAIDLRIELKKLREENKVLQARANHLNALYQQHAVDMEPEIEPVPVEKVTGEDNGKITETATDLPTTGTQDEGPDYTNMSVDDIFADLTGGLPVAETQDVLPTLEDELAAIQKDIENSSQVAEMHTMAEEFDDLLNKLNNHTIRRVVETYLDELVNGTKEFSLDYLNPFVFNKQMTQSQANLILHTAKMLADQLRGAIAEGSISADPTEVIPTQTIPEIQVTAPDAPDTPVVNHADPAVAVVPQNEAYHGGYKIVEAATTGATSTIGYEEGTKKDKDGKTVYIKVTKPDALNKEVPESILHPGKLLPNHELRYEVDVDYDGPKHITDSLSWDNNQQVVQAHEKGSDYLDDKGKVKTKSIPNTTVKDLERQMYQELGATEELRWAKPGDVLYDEDGIEYRVISKKDKYGRSLEYTKNGQGGVINPKTAGDYENKWATRPMWRKDPRPIFQRYEPQIKAAKAEPQTKEVHDPRVVGNVPIKAVDAKTGKTLFYIRTLDWLHAQFPGTKDYRNIVDTIETEDGVIDNLAAQTEKLMEIRTAIVERFNKEGKHTDGKIAAEGKGTGRLILNQVIESKDPETLAIKSKVVPDLAYNRKNPEKSMLPDTSLELVIVMEKGQTPHSALGHPTTKSLGFSPKELVKGGVGAMVPAANGQFMYAPLIGMKLEEEGKPSHALNSVVRAIELYLLNDGSNPEIQKEIDQLEAATGFNIGLTKGLRGFINQYYTYLQHFQDSALSPNASTGIKAEQFLFNVDDKLSIADKTRQIKAGFAMRGSGAVYANLVNGSLDPRFIATLKEGFATRSRAVVFSDNRFGIRGLNTSGKFMDAVYQPGKGWKHNEYGSYNEYVKSFSRTPVYGRNQLSDGTYVYAANPHLPLEVPDMRHNATLVTQSDKAQSIQPNTAQGFEADADLFDTLSSASMRPVPSRSVQAFGTGSDLSEPLTLKTLQEKYNFTAEVERNGKTPLEVYEELTARGHSYISKGFNPFSRCL